MALTDQTRAQLRRRIADVFNDVVVLDATGNGTTTTFVDTFNVNTGSESFDGREILFTSGSNAALVSRITSTTAATGTLTFTPSRTSTATGDDAEVYNRRNRGLTVAEYNRAINTAVEECNGLSLVPVIESIAAAFDMDDQTIAMPSTLFEAFRVEYQDTDDVWKEIKRAQRGGDGWSPEPSGAVIRVEGWPAAMADGQSIRVHGYRRVLSLDTDAAVCPFDGHAVVMAAAYRLCLSHITSDPSFGSLVLTLKDEYEQARNRLRVSREAGTVRVRL
jgi:hypothetical protein